MVCGYGKNYKTGIKRLKSGQLPWNNEKNMAWHQTSPGLNPVPPFAGCVDYIKLLKLLRWFPYILRKWLSPLHRIGMSTYFYHCWPCILLSYCYLWVLIQFVNWGPIQPTFQECLARPGELEPTWANFLPSRSSQPRGENDTEHKDPQSTAKVPRETDRYSGMEALRWLRGEPLFQGWVWSHE